MTAPWFRHVWAVRQLPVQSMERTHEPSYSKNRDLLGLSINEVNAISEVIRGHTVDALDAIEPEVVLGTDIVDIRKLAACLSMSDICHADESRAPEIVFRHLDLDEESARHWRRHLQIGGIARKDDRIRMSAVCFSDAGQKAVNDYKGEIERQLARVKPYFHSVLSRLTGVDLTVQRLESELDVTIRFRANAPAILNILVDGVYQRHDVFIRELVQNSIDACHLRRAKAMRRSEDYTARILISLLSVRGRLKAVRVDDNGIGMDIADIRDTVLWIGNTIADREEVRSLLAATTGKNLIATFGIGLLSCFKSGRRVLVRTAKENREPVQFSMSSISDEVSPSRPTDVSVGSTFIVEMTDETTDVAVIQKSISHYFRRVLGTDIRVLSLDWGETSQHYTREEIFRIATTEAKQVKSQDLPGNEKAFCTCELKGDDFSAWLWLDRDSESGEAFDIHTQEGRITILNEGVYVTTDNASEWLPEHLKLCSGLIDFAAGVVRLPVSRDTVVVDAKRTEKREELVRKSFLLIDALCAISANADSRIADLAVLTITYIHMKADDSSQERILKRIDGLHVATSASGRGTTLLSLRQQSPARVFVEYVHGRWVSDLAVFDGKQLYDNRDDLTGLQTALCRQGDEIVISATQADTSTDERILEAKLLAAYFGFHEIQCVDLAASDAISGLLRSKPIPRHVRDELSYRVKFVEVTGLPTKRGWKVGAETWVNIANEDMAFVYQVLQSPSPEDDRIRLAAILVDLLACRFQEGFNSILDLLYEQKS
jgi:hypothetical protein